MRLFEFSAPMEEDALDEAAPENARSIAIYNSLLDLKDTNPKAFKQKFIDTLVSEFPHLSPHRANAWLGFANKAYKAHQERSAGHDEANGPLAALRTKDILNRQNTGQRRAAAPGMTPSADNDLVSSDYDTKRLIADVERIVSEGNAGGSSEWYSAADGNGAVEVTWDLETYGKGDPEVQRDQANEVKDNKRTLDALAKRYQDRVISYDPVKQVGKYVGGRLKLKLDSSTSESIIDEAAGDVNKSALQVFYSLFSKYGGEITRPFKAEFLEQMQALFPEENPKKLGNYFASFAAKAPSAHDSYQQDVRSDFKRHPENTGDDEFTGPIELPNTSYILGRSGEGRKRPYNG